MTNKEITQYSAPVVQAYRDMEDELLMLIGRQIAKDGRLSDTSKWRVRQLARAGEINRQALDIISSYSEGISNEVYDAITEAAESEVGRLDEAMLNLLSEKGELTDDVQGMLNAYERQSRQELNVKNAEIADSYARALTERCNLVNTVMAANTKAGYTAAVSEISRAMNEMNAGASAVVSGNEGLHEATRRTIHRLARNGITGFTDKAGREWSPEAYVKMDLRTTMANTARAAQDARCDAYGVSLIEVSSHMGARPKCAPYQGRVFSRDGSRGVTEDLNGDKIEYIPLSETSYGEPDGLFGINCGHQQYPFIPGLSVKSYYPYPEEENAERYRELQAQRGMERKIRADKRECMMLQAAGDGDGLKEAAVRLRQDKSKYTDYCKAHGLGVHNENTQVYGYDRSKSMKTVWAERKMAAPSNGWSGATPIVHTKEEMTAVSEFAKLHGVQIYNPAQFDGDLELLKEQISVIDGIKREYGINNKITLMFQDMNDDDLAMSEFFTIKYNKNTLRSRAITNKNLQADDHLAALDVNGVTAHEMGHIISYKHGEKGLDIAKEAYYNIYNTKPSTTDILDYLDKNVSVYSASFKEETRGKTRIRTIITYPEVTSEVFSKDMYGNKTDFSSEFVRLLKGRCVR